MSKLVKALLVVAAAAAGAPQRESESGGNLQSLCRVGEAAHRGREGARGSSEPVDSSPALFCPALKIVSPRAV